MPYPTNSSLFCFRDGLLNQSEFGNLIHSLFAKNTQSYSLTTKKENDLFNLMDANQVATHSAVNISHVGEGGSQLGYQRHAFVFDNVITIIYVLGKYVYFSYEILDILSYKLSDSQSLKSGNSIHTSFS